MRHLIPPAFLIPALLLAACLPASPAPRSEPPLAPLATEPAAPAGDLRRVDEQGAVVVEITPLNLGSSSDQIVFEVALNTHSIDLSMDLAALATLGTDTGVSVPAALWDAPRGGHHVTGRLIFPAIQDGRPLLDGAGRLTLTIVDLDASVRLFEWQIP